MPEQKLAVETDIVKGMSPIERSEALMRVAMKSKEHMKRWAVESGRPWLIFDTAELIDALPPDPPPPAEGEPEQIGALELLTQFVACYRDHRACLPSTTGEMVQQKDPGTGKISETPKTKPETLEPVEIDRLIRWLVGEITAKDPTWSLDRSPM